MASDLTTPFAQPRLDRGETSLPAMLSGKLSRFLARNVRTKTLSMRNAHPLVSFTFDDAPASACSVGASMLEQHGARGTFYISGGGCGRDSPGGRLATIDQLQALNATGHELGCHTHSHVGVTAISPEELDRDLERNRAFLQDATGTSKARNFAYPYGDLSFHTKRRLENRFTSCRSLIPGLHTRTVDLGALKSVRLENSSTDQTRIREQIRATVQQNGWLIFCSHDVEEKPSLFGVSPDLLAFALSCAVEAGCRLVTVAAGLGLVRGHVTP
jgi:peptidoglycan/xylan/chitin deacetylase (PgdA/CDA1 family)